MKSIKMSDYFRIIKSTYVYLKLTPHNSIRNYNSDKIAKLIASLYRNLTQQIIRYENRIEFHCPIKASYFIYIEKRKVEFYFVVPEVYLTLFKDKIGDTWNGITIKKVDDLPTFNADSARYAMRYQKEDAFSLAVDKRTNALLESVLNVINVIEDGDKLGVFYNFMPTTQFTWRSNHERSIIAYRKNQPVEKNKLSGKSFFKLALTVIVEIANMITETLGGQTAGAGGNSVNFVPPSDASKRKKDETVLDTQIMLISESQNYLRNRNNGITVCSKFGIISEDNSMSYRKVKAQFDPIKYDLGIDKNKMSAKEIQNLIALPGRELLEEYKMIEKIDTIESEVPEELRAGTEYIGLNTYRGAYQRAYLSKHKEFKYCTIVIVGPTRAGKTTLISNLSRNQIDAGECTILFDFCGNCQLSDDVRRVVRRSLVIDCSDFTTLQGLGYNEVTPLSDSPFEVFRCAKTKASQFMTLIDAVNSEDNELRARMERFFESAAVVVFISNGPIKDAFNILQDHRLRKTYIERISDDQKDRMTDYVLTLEELDEVDKKTGAVIGTKLSISTGILNRVNRLKHNAYMELMLKQDCDHNVNLVDEMQKAQLICLKMPEIMFSTEQEKDVYCTYWLTKIWGALQKLMWEVPDRTRRPKVTIVFDELYQVPNCRDYLMKKLNQMAKFGGRSIISCHHIGQLGKLKDELKSANASYMLVAGSDKENYKELKEEIYPYEVEDLLNLKTYHSLNYIKTADGYAKFITRLPNPL